VYAVKLAAAAECITELIPFCNGILLNLKFIIYNYKYSDITKKHPLLL
jgi:hypothetical protein